MKAICRGIPIISLLALLISRCKPAGKTQAPISIIPSIPTLTSIPSLTPHLIPPPAKPSLTVTTILMPEIYDLNMIDALNGWAWTNDVPFRLLFTEDGGETWKDITPGEVIPGTAFFLNPQVGWVLTQISYPNHPEIPFVGTMYTSDGGNNWDLYPSGQIMDGKLHFSDRTHGWMKSTGSGGTQAAIFVMYQTANGGKTWQTVKAIPPTPNSFWSPDVISLRSGSTLYFDPDRMMILHLDWESPIQPGGSVRFEITFNHGDTWISQKLPIQGENSHLSVKVIQVIFSDVKGLLAVLLEGDPVLQKWIFYGTDDGGKTWKLIPGELDIPVEEWTWPDQFASIQDIFITCGNAICVMHDGAHTWQKSPRHDILIRTIDRRIVLLDFVDARNGWIEVWNVKQSPQYSIYRTTDGGVIWTLLHPTILTTIPPALHLDTSVPTPTLIPTPIIPTVTLMPLPRHNSDYLYN